ncbi:MAG: protoporphyrinogen oxidase [Gemmatales bacterium]
MPPSPRIVIVGAGFSGLSTAWELQSRLPEAQITLLEVAPEPGGTLQGYRRDGYLVEYGPISFPGHRLGLMKLCHKLELTKDLLAPSSAMSRKYILHEGQLQAVPQKLGAALTSPLLGFGSAFKLATERFRSNSGGKSKADETVAQFAERRVGPELGSIVADTLATEYFCGEGKAISVRAGFPQLARAEREYGSVLAGWPRLKEAERLAAAKAGITLTSDVTQHYSFADGLKTLAQRLVDKLQAKIELGIGAQTLRPAADGMGCRWLVHTSDGQVRQADHVILTCALWKQAALLADTDTALADAMLAIPHAGIITMALGYPRSLVPDVVESQQIVLPQRYKRELLRIEFPSSLFPHRAPDNHVLLQITMGGFHRPELMAWDEDALIVTVRRELRALLRIVKPPKFCHIRRMPRAMPQYTLGHQNRIQQVENLARAHPGLHVGGNALHGISLHDLAALAERTARTIRDEVKTGP